RPGNNAGPDDMEFQVARTAAGQSLLWASRYPEGRPPHAAEQQVQRATRADAHSLVYERVIPDAVLDPVALPPGAVVRLSTLQCDGDGGGRAGALTQPPRPGSDPATEGFPTFILMP